mgnify:FL=1
MTESGSNLTPDKLPMPERAPLLDICDRALRRIVESMQPRYVLGIGGFAEARVRAAVAGMSVTVGRIPHPSPASPAANRGWADAAEKALAEQGIMR